MQSHTETVDALIKECHEYINTDPELAARKAQEALQLSEKEKNDSGRFESLFVMGRISNNFNDNAQAVHYFEECLRLGEKLKEPLKTAMSKNALGIAYSQMDIHSRALELFLAALDIARGNDLAELECKVNNNISSVFSDLKDYTNCLKYLLLAYEKALTANLPVAVYLRNIANIYADIEKYEEAYEYALIARNANWKEKNQFVWADIYFILAVVTYKRGNPVRYLRYFQLAFRLAEKYHNFFAFAEGKTDMAEILLEEHQYDEAWECLDSAKAYSQCYEYFILNKPILKLYARLFREKGDPEGELRILREYVQADSDFEKMEFDQKRAYTHIQISLYHMQVEHRNLKAHIGKDPLTGVLSYRSFEERVNDALISSLVRGVLLFADLDNLKGVNDTFGHQTGDELIIEFARILEKEVEDRGLIFRKGGDEFIIFLPECSRKKAYEMVKRLFAQLALPRLVGKTHMNISCSIGIVEANSELDNARSLEAKADKAMYKAKNLGKGGFCFYDEGGWE